MPEPSRSTRCSTFSGCPRQSRVCCSCWSTSLRSIRWPKLDWVKRKKAAPGRGRIAMRNIQVSLAEESMEQLNRYTTMHRENTHWRLTRTGSLSVKKTYAPMTIATCSNSSSAMMKNRLKISRSGPFRTGFASLTTLSSFSMPHLLGRVRFKFRLAFRGLCYLLCGRDRPPPGPLFSGCPLHSPPPRRACPRWRRWRPPESWAACCRQRATCAGR